MSDKTKVDKQTKILKPSRAANPTVARSANESTPAAANLQKPINNAQDLAGGDVATLQQTYGNHFVQRLAGINGIDGGNAGVQPATDIESEIEQTRGGGSQLPDTFRSKMEGHFKSDFKGVRVHTGGKADQLSRSLNAKAFTTGSDIYFRQGDYDPDSQGGQKLIAHELTHVVQQGGTQRKATQAKLSLNEPDDKYEKEADAVAETAVKAPDSVATGGPPADEGEKKEEESVETADIKAESPEEQEAVELVEAVSKEDKLEEAAAAAGVSAGKIKKVEEDVLSGADPDKAVEDVAAEKKQQAQSAGAEAPTGDPEAAGQAAANEAGSDQEESEKKEEKEEEEKGQGEADKEETDEKGPDPAVVPEADIPDETAVPETSFETAEFEEPEMDDPLPTWGDLAYGTIQLQSAPGEIEWRNKYLGQSGHDTAPLSDDIMDSAEAALQNRVSEEQTDDKTHAMDNSGLDRSAMFRDALLGGMAEGAVEGVSSFISGQIMGAATGKIPHGSHLLEVANFAKDPKGWAEGIGKSFTGAFEKGGTFHDIGGRWDKEDTDAGRAAFVFEFALGMINWIDGMLGAIKKVLSLAVGILVATAIALKAAAAVLMALPFGVTQKIAAVMLKIAAFLMKIVKFLLKIIKFIGKVSGILGKLKPPLELLIFICRSVDFFQTKANPDDLKAKQAKLQGMVKDYTKNVTTRTLTTIKGQITKKVKDLQEKHDLKRKTIAAQAKAEAADPTLSATEKQKLTQEAVALRNKYIYQYGDKKFIEQQTKDLDERIKGTNNKTLLPGQTQTDAQADLIKLKDMQSPLGRSKHRLDDADDAVKAAQNKLDDARQNKKGRKEIYKAREAIEKAEAEQKLAKKAHKDEEYKDQHPGRHKAKKVGSTAFAGFAHATHIVTGMDVNTIKSLSHVTKLFEKDTWTGKAIKEYYGEQKKKWGRKWEYFKEDISLSKEEMKEFGSKAKQKITGAPQKVKDKFSEAADWFSQKGKDIKGGVKDPLGTLDRKGKEFTHDVVGAFHKLKGDYPKWEQEQITKAQTKADNLKNQKDTLETTRDQEKQNEQKLEKNVVTAQGNRDKSEQDYDTNENVKSRVKQRLNETETNIKVKEGAIQQVKQKQKSLQENYDSLKQEAEQQQKQKEINGRLLEIEAEQKKAKKKENDLQQELQTLQQKEQTQLQNEILLTNKGRRLQKDLEKAEQTLTEAKDAQILQKQKVNRIEKEIEEVTKAKKNLEATVARNKKNEQAHQAMKETRSDNLKNLKLGEMFGFKKDDHLGYRHWGMLADAPGGGLPSSVVTAPVSSAIGAAHPSFRGKNIATWPSQTLRDLIMPPDNQDWVEKYRGKNNYTNVKFVYQGGLPPVDKVQKVTTEVEEAIRLKRQFGLEKLIDDIDFAATAPKELKEELETDDSTKNGLSSEKKKELYNQEVRQQMKARHEDATEESLIFAYKIDKEHPPATRNKIIRYKDSIDDYKAEFEDVQVKINNKEYIFTPIYERSQSSSDEETKASADKTTDEESKKATAGELVFNYRYEGDDEYKKDLLDPVKSENMVVGDQMAHVNWTALVRLPSDSNKAKGTKIKGLEKATLEQEITPNATMGDGESTRAEPIKLDKLEKIEGQPDLAGSRFFVSTPWHKGSTEVVQTPKFMARAAPVEYSNLAPNDKNKQVARLQAKEMVVKYPDGSDKKESSSTGDVAVDFDKVTRRSGGNYFLEQEINKSLGKTGIPGINVTVVYEAQGATAWSDENDDAQYPAIQRLPIGVKKGPGELVIQRMPDEEEEEGIAVGGNKPLELIRREEEVKIVSNLPEPPNEAISQVTESALAHNSLNVEEASMKAQQQQLAAMQQDSQAQQQDLLAGEKVAETQQEAIAVHQQDIKAHQEAQQNMAGAAKEGQTPAGQSKDISGMLNDVVSGAMNSLLKAVGLAGAHAGADSKQGDVSKANKGVQQQKPIGEGAVQVTTDAEALAKKWHGETKALEANTAVQFNEMQQTKEMLEDRRAETVTGMDGLELAMFQSQTQLDEIQDEKSDQEMEHGDALLESELWADEHYTMRQSLFADLEAELSTEEDRRLGV